MTLLIRFLALVFSALAFFCPEKSESKMCTGYYPKTALVIEVNAQTDTVFAEDYAGNVWAFYGAEDWCVGDFTSMIMNDMETQTVYDDEIVSVRYAGCGSWE